MSQGEDALRSAIESAGLSPPAAIIADGKLHRFSSSGKRGDDAGWYVLHEGDMPAGAFGCWRAGITRNWRGTDGRSLSPAEREAWSRRTEALRLDRERDASERIATAGALWRAGKDPRGTAAERYLVGRGIMQWPSSAVRYIGGNDVARLSGRRSWRWPAVMFAATDDAGAVVGVQLVALSDDGAPLRDGEGNKIKRSRGVLSGAVRLPGDPAGPLALAEGPETGLSIWLATGCETWVCLGSIKRAPLDSVPVERVLMACRDDDPIGKPGHSARKIVERATKAWRKEGHTVLEATPWALSRNDGSDFNDLLKAGGVEAVRARFDAAMGGEPPSSVARLPLPVARERLRQGIESSMGQLLAPRDTEEAPPFLVHRVGLGIGKSESALNSSTKCVRRGARGAYSVSTHRLGSEILKRARRLAGDMPIAVWRGRKAKNPKRPSQKMCVRPDLIEAAETVGASAKDTVCATCPARDACAYLAQEGQSADFWIVTTDLLFQERPRAIGDLDFLIVDESFVLSGMEGFDKTPDGDDIPILITRAMLEAMPVHGSGSASKTADLIKDLMPARRKLLAVLDAAPEGNLRRALAIEACLTLDERSASDQRSATDQCNEMAKLERKRLRRLPQSAADGEAAMLAALKATRGNRDVQLCERLWRHLAALLADDGPERSGRIVVEIHDGAPAFRLFSAKRFSKGWNVPTLHIDATADMRLIRERVGSRAKLVQEIEAETPHMNVLQFVGRFGMTALKDDRYLERVWAWIVASGRWWGGEWLVVANKGVEDRVRAVKREHGRRGRGESEADQNKPLPRLALPGFIHTAHFNATRGVDRYRDVRGEIIVGRPMPPPITVERMRGAITGRATPTPLPPGSYYPRAMSTITPRNGAPRSVETEAHPDPLCEAIRAAICEAELEQAGGRGRGVNRDADAPLQVLILGNCQLAGLPPDEVLDWEPPTADVEAFARTGVWVGGPADMAALAGVKARTIEAVRERKLPAFPTEWLSLGFAGNLSVGAYARRRRGPRAHAASPVVFDPRTTGSLKKALTDRLGPLRRLHDPSAPDGGVRCQITGVLDFGLAPVNYQGVSLE